MTFPSLVGLIPISLAIIAFSTSCKMLLSNGVIIKTRASGIWIEAIWFKGVGAP